MKERNNLNGNPVPEVLSVSLKMKLNLLPEVPESF